MTCMQIGQRGAKKKKEEIAQRTERMLRTGGLARLIDRDQSLVAYGVLVQELARRRKASVRNVHVADKITFSGCGSIVHASHAQSGTRFT